MFIWLVVAIGSTVFLFTYYHRLLVDRAALGQSAALGKCLGWIRRLVA